MEFPHTNNDDFTLLGPSFSLVSDLVVMKERYKSQARIFGTAGMHARRCTIMPIWRNHHWFLVVVDGVEKIVKTYDSLSESRKDRVNEAGQLVLSFLQTDDNANGRCVTEWFFSQMKAPQQNNGYDCCFFMLEMLRCLLVGRKDFNFCQDDMQYVRRKILAEILQDKLIL